jgi:hypothetical protein
MKNKSYSKEKADENLKYSLVVLIVLFLFAIFLGLYISWMFSSRDAIILCSGIVIGTCFYYIVEKVLQKKFLPPFGRYKGYRQGAAGEAIVDKALIKNFGDEFLILSDVMLEKKKGNIDHIVIGKYGVFVIETKTYHGEIICYDDNDWVQEIKIGEKIIPKKLKPSPSKQVKSNAVRLKHFFREHYKKISNEWIWAFVVFPQSSNLVIKSEPKECEIFESIDTMVDAIKRQKMNIELTSDDLSELKNIFLAKARVKIIS